MEWLDILQRIEAGESRLTEFKRGLGDLSAVGRAICAFANAEGGVIVLGISDRGEIVGVKEDAERVQERLTAFLQTGCSTPVSARTGRYRGPERLGALGGGASPTRLRADALRRARLDSARA